MMIMSKVFMQSDLELFHELTVDGAIKHTEGTRLKSDAAGDGWSRLE